MDSKRMRGDSYLWGISLIVAGVLFFWLKADFARLIFLGVALLFLLQVFYQAFLKFRMKGQRTSVSWFNLLLNGLLIFFLINNAFLPTGLLALFVTVEFFIIGLILLIDYSIQFYNKGRPSLVGLIDGSVHFIFGIVTLVRLEASLNFIYALFGLSLILRGSTTMLEAWHWDKETVRGFGRRKKLGLPIFLSAIIPVGALRAINNRLSPDKSRPILLGNTDKKGQNPDIEIWIHTARRGFEMMGHVDISYQGVTYAYGQYDVDSSALFGMIGDGVLFRLSSEAYLDSLAQEDWRVVAGYGMLLTKQQKQAVEERIRRIMEQTTPFVLKTENQKQSYLGQLSNRYGVESFKFTRSQFKIYFVMTTNCVLLADTILEAIGTDNVANHGILTPGIYQDYFEREYLKPNSAVITKFVLGKKSET